MHIAEPSELQGVIWASKQEEGLTVTLIWLTLVWKPLRMPYTTHRGFAEGAIRSPTAIGHRSHGNVTDTSWISLARCFEGETWRNTPILTFPSCPLKYHWESSWAVLQRPKKPHCCLNGSPTSQSFMTDSRWLMQSAQGRLDKWSHCLWLLLPAQLL